MLKYMYWLSVFISCQAPTYLRFESSARAELDRYLRDIRRDDPRYLMSRAEEEEFMRAVEHEMRMEEFHRRIEPLIKLQWRMHPLGGFSFALHPDGSLADKIEHWSDQQRKAIASIDAMIAWHASECGVGPKCELPSLVYGPTMRATAHEDTNIR